MVAIAPTAWLLAASAPGEGTATSRDREDDRPETDDPDASGDPRAGDAGLAALVGLTFLLVVALVRRALDRDDDPPVRRRLRR